MIVWEPTIIGIFLLAAIVDLVVLRRSMRRERDRESALQSSPETPGPSTPDRTKSDPS